ncbi:MAG: hypothetical protein SF123_02435 [Chloroflexota bacterium]|nr:hypothetical protein [Chloroflexota bacterium]
MTTWTIAVNWNRDGDFSDANEDVTSLLISATWVLGTQKPWQDIADNSVLKLTLNNADRRFSSENSSSPLSGMIVPQRPVRIQSNDGTTTRTHWVGWIESIEPVVGRYGKRTVEIIAAGAMQFLKATETKLQLQENKKTSDIIAELIKEVVIPPALSQAWVLGRVGNSEVGASTYLADTSAYSSLDTGTLTLAIAADNWVIDGTSDAKKQSFDVYRAIGDVTAAERGRFFFDREGKAVFWNRHKLLQGGTPAATFDDTMTEMVYSYAGMDHLKNEVIVVCHPRRQGASLTDTLWELGESVINVAAGKTRKLYVQYEDDSGKRIGARNVAVDLPSLTFAQGTATVTVEAKANGAELVLVNSGTVDAVVTALKVVGRKIFDDGEIEASALDSGSIIDYGRRTLKLNLPSIDNVQQAQYIADFERDRRKQPKGMVNAVTVKSHGRNGGTHHAQQLALTIGSLVRVKETQTGHDAQYYVMGEAHELTHGATLWKTTWYLEPAPTTAELPWKLDTVGRAELGTNTRLAY